MINKSPRNAMNQNSGYLHDRGSEGFGHLDGLGRDPKEYLGFENNQDGPGYADYDTLAKQQRKGNKKRVQFVEESLESSIYDTHQFSEDDGKLIASDEPEEDDQIIDNHLILTHEQQEDFGDDPGSHFQDMP